MIAIPKLGVQLETTRGISLSLLFLGSSNTYRIRIPISTSRAFTPLDQISTIVVQEGLRRWRVEYYLAVIKRSGSGISVGFSVSPPN
jgi:phosphatidylinositol glycan class H protein